MADNAVLPIILGFVAGHVAIYISMKVEDWLKYRRYKKAERDGTLVTSDKLNAEFEWILNAYLKLDEPEKAEEVKKHVRT